jgi:predicted TIM-barrel fold metal-dependent hydrolase
MIIDFHTHIFPSYFRDQRDRFFSEEPAFELLYRSPESRLAGREELIENMDEEGVQKSVVFGFPWESAERFRRNNDYIIESVQHYPDRLIGFCSFSMFSPQALGEVDRCLASGLSGIGELACYTPDFQIQNSALGDIMALCSQYDVPLLLHTNEPVGHTYPGKTAMTLKDLYRFLGQYPSNRIVLAHWGGGLFFYALMKREVKEILKNVWFDTAASPYLYDPDVYRVAGDIIGNEKIIFGSDYPLLKPGRYFGEMKSAKLSSQSFNKITGENAANLLKL